jgi:hypothetical protein
MTEEKRRHPSTFTPEEQKEICARKLYAYDRLPKRVRAALADSTWGMSDKLMYELNIMLDGGADDYELIRRVREFTGNIGERFYTERMYPRPPAKGTPHVDRAAAYVPRPLPEKSGS